RDDLAVIALGEQIQNGRFDRYRDRPHAAIAETELADAGMVAAELRIETIGRPQGKGIEGAGGTSAEDHRVPIVTTAVRLGAAVTELVGANVFLADEEGVAQAV